MASPKFITMKKTLYTLLNPGLKTALFVIVCAVPVTVVGLLMQDHPFSYFAYLYSAYALVVLCTNIPRAKRRIHELLHGDDLRAVVWLRNKMNSHALTARYMHDKDFRATVALYSGQLINLLYASYKISTGIYYDSSWMWTGGIYYAVIFAIRFYLAHDIRNIPDKSDARFLSEMRTYRKCGSLLLILSLAMSGMTIQMTVNNKHNEYPGFIIIINALFTFIYFFTAAAKLVSFSKRNSPILKASKNLSMIAAAMSMYTLQTDMIPAFGNDDAYRKLMNIITGSAVMVFCVGMSVYMLIRSSFVLKRSRG